MSQKLMVFAGKKQAGKTSAANFVSGYTLRSKGIFERFNVDDNGKLWVNAVVKDPEGQLVDGMGEFDLKRRDDNFINFAISKIWPFVKIYGFSDALKGIAMEVFGLSWNSVNGTNEQKNAPTHIKWKDMCNFLPPRIVGFMKKDGTYNTNMSGREFLQYFGTNVCRTLYNDCWVNETLNRIKVEAPELAIVEDCRFLNEFKAMRDAGAKIVHLKRGRAGDNHASEVGLNKLRNEDFDLVIDNTDMDIQDKNDKIYHAMCEWGWVDVVETAKC